MDSGWAVNKVKARLVGNEPSGRFKGGGKWQLVYLWKKNKKIK